MRRALAWLNSDSLARTILNWGNGALVCSFVALVILISISVYRYDLR